MVRDTKGKILELHQQKYIRKILLKFDQYLPKRKHDGQEFTHMHYTPTVHPTVMQNMSIVDSPETDEDKELMSQLPYASVVGHLQYLNTCTRPDLAYVL